MSGEKKPAKSDGSTARVERAWKEAWTRTWPHTADVGYAYGRDRKLLRDLVAKLGEDQVVTLIGQFFDAVLHDPVVSRVNKPGVPALVYHAPYLLLRTERQRPHPRTQENLAEARKAMGKRDGD